MIGTAEAAPYDLNRPYVGRPFWGARRVDSHTAERFPRLADVEYLVDTENAERFLM